MKEPRVILPSSIRHSPFELVILSMYLYDLLQIAFRSIRQRGFASVLTMFSMSLGVMLVVAVLSIHGVVDRSFRNNASLGYNLIIGGKGGGEEQLTLSTVYYLSRPLYPVSGNYYLEFMPRKERDRQMVHSFAHRSHEANTIVQNLRQLTSLGGSLDFVADKLLDEVEEQQDALRADLNRPGRYAHLAEFAIPVCLGDYFDRFRVVATNTELFDSLVYDIENQKKFEFAQGRNLQHFNEEHTYFEAVLGSNVGRELKTTIMTFDCQGNIDLAMSQLASTSGVADVQQKEQTLVVTLLSSSESLSKTPTSSDFTLSKPRTHKRPIALGDKFSPSHGFQGGGAHASMFTIVGILKPSGTPNDRAVFINMEGFYLMEGHSEPVDEAKQLKSQEEELAAIDKLPKEQRNQAWLDYLKRNRSRETGPNQEPLAVEQRKITALLLKTPLEASIDVEKAVNKGKEAQAVMPIRVITGMFSFIVDPIRNTLLVLTSLICVVSAISILVSIYNSMSERRHEIAVMRALGAGRNTVLTIILLESMLLSLGGGFVGWVVGHVGCLIASPKLEEQIGVKVGLNLWGDPFFEPLKWFGLQGSLAESIVIPMEWTLIPGLMLLAILVGLLPAIAAYRTDVAKSLGK
jgi:putative ABC transport system permease protein